MNKAIRSKLDLRNIQWLLLLDPFLALLKWPVPPAVLMPFHLLSFTLCLGLAEGVTLTRSGPYPRLPSFPLHLSAPLSSCSFQLPCAPTAPHPGCGAGHWGKSSSCTDWGALDPWTPASTGVSVLLLSASFSYLAVLCKPFPASSDFQTVISTQCTKTVCLFRLFLVAPDNIGTG